MTTLPTPKNKKATFVHLKNYTSGKGEVSDYTILTRIKYKSLVEKSIVKLATIEAVTQDEISAKAKIMESLSKSLKNEREHYYEEYVSEDGVKIPGFQTLKSNPDKVYITGRVVSKKIIQASQSKPQKQTVESKMRDSLPISKYRTFEISKSKLQSLTIDGDKITL